MKGNVLSYSKKAFTLIELLIVVCIVALLATFAMPAYRKAQDRARDNEAREMLKFIQHAQTVYHMECMDCTDQYLDCTSSSDCSQVLNLNLSGEYWNYTVTVSGSAFCAQAEHTVSGNPRSWYIDQDDDEVNGTGCN